VVEKNSEIIDKFCLLYGPRCVILCAGNLTEEEALLMKFQFATGVGVPGGRSALFPIVEGVCTSRGK
jgi:hypothetical protein